MKKMKKFLDENQPNNILNYLDPKKGFDASYVDWYESDAANSKNPIYAFGYKVVMAKPKIQWWVTKQLSDFIYSAKRVIARFRK